MKIVPYRDTDDMTMKKAILPQTQEEGELIHKAIYNLSKNPDNDLSQDDIEDLALILEEFDKTAHTNPVALKQ